MPVVGEVGDLLAALRATGHQPLRGLVVALAGGAVRAGGCGVRDPCANHLATAVSDGHGVAVNVLVEGVHDQTSKLETCPIYVRIVEVAGSSPVTSTKSPSSGPIRRKTG